MTDAQIIREYARWTDDQLLDHRDACRREATTQYHYGAAKAAALCKERAQLYTRALALRGYGHDSN